MIKAALIGITGVLLFSQVKAIKQEYAWSIMFATGILLAVLVVSKLGGIIEEIKGFAGSMETGSVYIPLLLKIIGITYIAEFSADLCQDAGFKAAAGQIELFAKLSILMFCMPVIMALLDTMKGILGIG